MTILLPTNIITYIKKQTAKGTYAYPGAADAIPDLEVSGSFAKIKTVEDLQRKTDSYSIHDYFTMGFEPGTASIKCPIRPGTYPTTSGEQLLIALFGKQTLNAIQKTATYLLRAPNDEEDYWTIAIKYDDVITWFFDCLCHSGSMTFSSGASVDDACTLNTEWDSLYFAIAGTSTLSEDAALGATQIKVAVPIRYSPNAQIKIGADNQIYTITAVNYTTSYLSISPALAAAHTVGEQVVGYIATAAFPAGKTLWSGKGYYKEDAANIAILEGSLNIDHGTEVIYEKLNTEAPTQVLRAGKRNVTMTTNRLATTDNSEFLLYPFLLKDQTIVVQWGGTAAPYVQADIPIARCMSSSYDIGTFSGIRLPVEYRALANFGNDELSLTVYME